MSYKSLKVQIVTAWAQYFNEDFHLPALPLNATFSLSFPSLLLIQYRTICAQNICAVSHNPTLFNFNGTLGSCSVPEIKGNNLFEIIIILSSAKNCFGKLQLQLFFPSSPAIIAKCSLFFLSQAASLGKETLAKCKQVWGRFLVQVTVFQAQRIQKASHQNLPWSPVV